MEKLDLYIPKIDELWFYQKMMSDPDTMSYNANYDISYRGYHKETGCIDFPKEEWEDWYSWWIGQEPKRFFAYIRRCENSEWIGNINFHYNPQKDWYDMGIVLYSPYRGKGYAQEALKLLLEHAFNDCDVNAIHNDFETTRVAARKAHIKAGFKEISITNDLVELLITKADYEASK